MNDRGVGGKAVVLPIASSGDGGSLLRYVRT